MLSDANDAGTVTLKIGVHPLQQWVWWGALVVVAAGAWSFASKGKRRNEAATGSAAGRA
jgi:cytochrome c biogenesis factor